MIEKTTTYSSSANQNQGTPHPDAPPFSEGSGSARVAPPPVACKGLTFLPIPEFDDATCAFGAPERAFFNRRDLPKVPREFTDEASRLFFSGGALPEFGGDVDQAKAKRALRAWLSSWAPAHEAKEAIVAYALWVWSPAAALSKSRASGAEVDHG